MLPTSDDDFEFNTADFRTLLEEQERTAFHEAGHAVAVLYFGEVPRLAEIDLTGTDRLGRVVSDRHMSELVPDYWERLSEPPSDIDKRGARRHAVVLAAGRVAERLFSESRDDEAALRGAREDMSAERLILAGCFGEDAVDREVEAAERNAEALLNREDAREMVRAIASELIQRSTDEEEPMDGQALLDLLEAVPGSEYFFGLWFRDMQRHTKGPDV